MARPSAIGPARVGLLSGVVVMVAVAGCARPASAPASIANPDPRVEAVVGFRVGDGAILYALHDARRFSWAFAPAMRVPATDNVRIHGAGSADSARRPLVVLVRGRAGGRPYVDVSLLEAGFEVAGIAGEEDRIARPCLGESWLAAFFVEGLGPRPLEPVVIHYTADEKIYRLRVDPKRHTLRAPLALHLKGGMRMPTSVFPIDETCRSSRRTV